MPQLTFMSKDVNPVRPQLASLSIYRTFGCFESLIAHGKVRLGYKVESVHTITQHPQETFDEIAT